MVGALPFVLVLALGAAQGGFFPDSWVWATPLAAWAAALGALLGGAPALRRAWAWVATAGGLLGWTLASQLWSASPAQSLLEARRAALYAAVALALVVLARGRTVRETVVGTHAAISLLLAYALARHLAGGPGEGDLVAQPLGYANAAGILAALGILLGAGAALHARSRAHRAAALSSLPVLGAALWLTGSRGALLALAAGALVAALAGPARMWRLPRRALALLAVLALAAVATGAAFTGGSEPRASYWRVAWQHEVLAHPVLGTGAGTFGRSWLRFGDPGRYAGALDAHSLYVETLGELGPLGLLLVCALLLLPLAGVARRPLGPYGATAAGAYAAFLVHAGVDWDWEMPAVVVAGLACAVALLLGDEQRRLPSPAPARAAAVVAALALGGFGLAGMRSDVVPAAKAPPGGALATQPRR